MIHVPRDASDAQVLEIIGEWIDALAREDYEAAFQALGYALAYGEPGAECIRNEIKRYRSPDYYPGVEEFTVTSRLTAQGGNPAPIHDVTWYIPNEVGGTGLVASIAYDLPLNGKWSDLCADFMIFENANLEESYILSLEEIRSSSQSQREIEAFESALSSKPNQER